MNRVVAKISGLTFRILIRSSPAKLTCSIPIDNLHILNPGSIDNNKIPALAD